MKKTKKQKALDSAFISARDGIASFAKGLQYFAKHAELNDGDERVALMQQHLDKLVGKATRRNIRLRWGTEWWPSTCELDEAQEIMDGNADH